MPFFTTGLLSAAISSSRPKESGPIGSTSAEEERGRLALARSGYEAKLKADVTGWALLLRQRQIAVQSW
jgi:hypothetical protein